MTLMLLIDGHPLRSFSRDFKLLKHCALSLKENIKLNDVVQLLYIMYSALYCSGTLQYSPAGSDFGATLIEIFGVPLFSLSANKNGKTWT